MKAIFAIVMLSAAAALCYASPLDLDTSKQHSRILEIDGFRYFYGDISGYRKLIYIGTEDIAGFETELHVDFENRKITQVVLILGPAGIDDQNCILKYKKIVKVLNKKYGRYTHQVIEKDPLIEDLLAVSICHPVQVGLYNVTTFWNFKNITISAFLLGDSDGFFVEIEYKFRPRIKNETKKLLKAL